MHELLGLPLNASAHGGEIDNMIVVIHGLMLMLFVGWGSFLTYVFGRFRRSRHPQADHGGVKSHLSSYVEGAVAVFEVVLLVGFAFPLWAQRVSAVPDEASSTVVRVVAEQFAWNVHYPGRDGVFGRTEIRLVSADNPVGLDRTDPEARDDIVSVNVMNIPLGKPVVVKLSSKDVIHSFGLPLFRVKQDAIPGEVFNVWFEPTMTSAEIQKVYTRSFSIAGGYLPAEFATMSSAAEYADADGNVLVGIGGAFNEEVIAGLNAAGITEVMAYPDTPSEIACAQLCGLGHFRMRGFLTVQSPEEFQEWLMEQEQYIVLDEPMASLN